MQNFLSEETNNYLSRFDEILNNMANKMLDPKLEDSVTINFIICMIPHHEAAIYMCENLLKYTQFLPLKQIAQDIIRMQTKGVAQMKEIEKTTGYIITSEIDNNSYLDSYFMITKKMIYKMENSLRTNNINLDFISEMIPHHEGAIDMCNNLLQYNIDPRLRMLAENIIREQSQGVEDLLGLKKLFWNVIINSKKLIKKYKLYNSINIMNI